MNMSRGLFLALMAMDAYNRGYGKGVLSLPIATPFLGSAEKVRQSDIESDTPGVDAGFYAIAYKTTADIGDKEHGGVIPSGTIIISYRGTDDKPDVMNDAMFISGVGVPPQALLAAQFYRSVRA